jgi:TetR/AcrR family tetracycline transcriptional repressor
MSKPLSRLDRLKAAAKAHADAERARLEERAAAGDERSAQMLARQREREDEMRRRMERTVARQQEWQRRFQQRIDQKHAQMEHKRGRIQPEDVVRVGLDLLQEKGLEGVTLRDVATQLKVQAPALYWHFANKREMVDAMAQGLLADYVATLEPPASPAEWRPWMRQMAHGFRNAMLARRDGARVVAGAGFGRAPALAALIDLALQVLGDAGFDPVTASAGTRSVISYAFGAVIEEQAGPDLEADTPAMEQLTAEFPSIARAIDAQLQLSPTAQFDMGLELILRGLEARR